MPVSFEAQKLLTWFPRDDHDFQYTPADIPIAGRTFSMILSLVTLCVISVCLIRRVQNIHKWSRLPLGAWYIILIYTDSFLFVFITAVFKDVGLNETIAICRGAILLCLTLYLSTKVCVYLFLVEKAYIVRGSNAPRIKDKLYIFNICAAMGPYGVLAVLNIVWRFSRVDNGTCIIGMEKKAMMPLIVFDAAVNIYLTALFIYPLRQLYSYKTQANGTLHTMAVRAFIGSCATLTSSITNLTLLMVLDGEPAWVCFLSCNAEILFSVLTLHWVTSRDRSGETNRSYTRSGQPSGSGGAAAGGSGSNHLSHSRSRGAKNKIGTETLISEHYQAQGAAAWPSEEDLPADDRDSNRNNQAATPTKAIAGNAWPADTRAVIQASCGRGDSPPAGAAYVGEGIALNRIVVTQESEVRREDRRVSGLGGMGAGAIAGRRRRGSRGYEDAESDTTTGSLSARGREGSTDGIVQPPPGPVHMV